MFDPEGARAESGFSLVEAMVALALILAALVMSMAFLAEQPRLIRRLDARERADRAIEATFETLRARELRLASGPPQWWVAPPPEAVSVMLDLDVEEEESLDGLYRVTVTATYVLEEQARQRSVTSMVWRP